MRWVPSGGLYIYCGREHNEGALFLLRGDFGERTRQNKKRVHAFLFCRVLSPKFSRSKNKDLELCNLCRNCIDCYFGAIWRVISIIANWTVSTHHMIYQCEGYRQNIIYTIWVWVGKVMDPISIIQAMVLNSSKMLSTTIHTFL